jgi:hypothetical protein
MHIRMQGRKGSGLLYHGCRGLPSRNFRQCQNAYLLHSDVILLNRNRDLKCNAGRQGSGLLDGFAVHFCFVKSACSVQTTQTDNKHAA